MGICNDDWAAVVPRPTSQKLRRCIIIRAHELCVLASQILGHANCLHLQKHLSSNILMPASLSHAPSRLTSAVELQPDTARVHYRETAVLGSISDASWPTYVTEPIGPLRRNDNFGRMWDVEDHELSRQSVYTWRLDCRPCTLAALYPQKSFGTYFCYRLSNPRSNWTAGRFNTKTDSTTC